MKTICTCGHARERHKVPRHSDEKDHPCHVCGCLVFTDAAAHPEDAIHAALIILGEIRDMQGKLA